jgi:hypothetical protein
VQNYSCDDVHYFLHAQLTPVLPELDDLVGELFEPAALLDVVHDGMPADPPNLTTAVPTWHEGDTVLIRPGCELEIVAIESSRDDAHGTWKVRRR